KTHGRCATSSRLRRHVEADHCLLQILWQACEEIIYPQITQINQANLWTTQRRGPAPFGRGFRGCSHPPDTKRVVRCNCYRPIASKRVSCPQNPRPTGV